MKYMVLSNDGMSEKPFEVSEVEAKDKEEAYEKLEANAPTNFCSDWVLTGQEFNNLKEVINQH